MTPGQIAHDAGKFDRKWEHMGESQKADWERIAQAVILAQQVSVPVVSVMTSERAAYFMRRFKKEEKLLGPNEQKAIDYVLAMLAAAPQPPQPPQPPQGDKT